MPTDFIDRLRLIDPELLPPGRVIAAAGGGPPCYWLSDGPADVYRWCELRAAHPRSGLWPLLISGLKGDGAIPWSVDAEYLRRLSSPGDHDVAALLAGWWANVGGPEADPDHPDWPGLTPARRPTEDPDEFAEEVIGILGDMDVELPLALVPAARGADALTVAGWSGPLNHTNDTAEISAVLRSWEDRFGARVYQVGFDTLDLTVAAAPTTVDEALPIAAEHFAFCPDNVWQGTGSLRSYAEQLVGKLRWSFWWD